MSEHVRESLSAYLDHELAPGERATVEAHLATCGECASFLDQLAAVDSAVAELPLPETSDDSGFAARVRARIEAEAGAPRARGPWPQAVRRPPAWTLPLTLVIAYEPGWPPRQQRLGYRSASSSNRPATAARPPA